MQKCFYCNKKIHYYLIKRYGLDICTICCGWSNYEKLNKCIVCHVNYLFTDTVCSKKCYTRYKNSIYDDNRCFLCSKVSDYSYFHHCNIPIKSKYMNVNIK